MKNIKQLLIIPLIALLFVSCEKEDYANYEAKTDGFINITFTRESIDSELKYSFTDETEPKYIVITIKNSDEDYALNAKKFELIKLGDGYFTENIKLEEGAYTIEDFLVLSSNDSTIYLTPKINSKFEHLVSHPLPYAFNVLANETSEITLDVIPAGFGSAEDYGYAFFTFNIIKTFVVQPDSLEGIDAFIEYWPYNEYSDRNFGMHPEFSASAWTSSGVPLAVRSLIKFNLASISTDAEIISARLYLYSVDNTVNGPGHSTLSGSNAFILQKVTSDWDESLVTWNTQPSATEEGQILLPASDSALQDYIINITDLVQGMVNDPLTNFGMMIKLEQERYYRRILFASSDHDQQTKHPKLEISYK
jgi:hypothetical protein